MGKIKHILVTGGNGFLGSFVLRKLIAEGFSPVLFLRKASNTWRIDDVIGQCKVVRCTERSEELKKLFNDNPIDAILHLATEYGRGKSFSELLNTNVIFPMSLIEEGVKHHLKLFINTDSFFAKREYSQIYLKEYTSSKRALEQLFSAFANKLKISNLRIEHVYGERDADEKFFTSIIKRLLKSEKVIELTAGEQKRDFIYAEDVANAFIAVIKNYEKLDNYQEFEVGTGKSVKLRLFVEKIAAAVGTSTELKFGALPTREGDIANSFANLENLKKIGWSQQFTTDEAINHIIIKEKERLKL